MSMVMCTSCEEKRKPLCRPDVDKRFDWDTRVYVLTRVYPLLFVDIMPEFEPVFTVDASSEGVQDLVSDLATDVPSEDRYLFDTVRKGRSCNWGIQRVKARRVWI